MEFGDSNKNDYIIKGPDTGFTPEPKGLGYTFYQYMSRNKNLVAQIDSSTGAKDTYGHLLKRCIRTALEMRAQGITSKDIITICSFNQINSCVPLIASLFLGVKPACLDPLLSRADIIHLIKQVPPRMAFVGPEAIELMEEAIAEANVDTKIVIFGPSDKHTEFLQFATAKMDPSFAPVELEDNKETAIVFFSSGTTGLPKGICLSHYAILGQAYTMVYSGFSTDVSLLFASFYWISATFLLTACILSGGSRLVVPRFNPDQFWKLIDRFKVTMTFMAPSQAIAIYKRGRPEGINTTNLADVIIGGGPLAAEHMEEIRELFPGANCNIVYGQTEVAGVVTNFKRNVRQEIIWMYQKPGSAGTIAPDTYCKVVDSESEEALGPGKKGELRLKTKYEMNGYYDRDSSEAWDEQGWLRTGDVAFYDENYCFYIVDRIKEMLKFQSFHVPPAVIENVLLNHPKVASAVVVGVPHDEDGDHPLGIISLKNPDDKIDLIEIEKFVEDKLDDRHRLRAGVKIMAKIPVTATGKIKRSDLKKMVLNNEI